MDECEETLKKIVNLASTVILDIEGTTTSIRFVENELFPYFGKCFEEYIKLHWNDDKIKEVINILINEQDKLKDCKHHTPFVPMPSVSSDKDKISKYQEQVISHLRWQFSEDFKTTGLKKLQGLVWMEAYNKDLISGHVYDDVVQVLDLWKSKGKKIFIYSSGSVEAQKLLFSKSVMGNLDIFIDGNFDTTIGSKVESESYLKIAKELNENPENIVFFTDRPKEISAAKKCGMKVIRVERDEYNHYLEEEKEYLGQEDGVVNTFMLFSCKKDS